MSNWRLIPKKKEGKYPIQRDEFGRSLRRRAFELFDEGNKPAEVSQILGMKIRTAYRYFADWKKCPPRLQQRYRMLKRRMKSDPELSQTVVSMVSNHLGMPEWKVILFLGRPHGLKQLLQGKFINYREQRAYSEQEARLTVALELIGYLETCGMPPEEIRQEIRNLIDKAKRHHRDNKPGT